MLYGYYEVQQEEFITLEILLERISEEEIFSLFIEEPIDLDSRYKAPYREDKNGDCYFEYYNGFLMFVDFAYTPHTMNCIGFIMQCLQCTYGEALDYVYKNLNVEDKKPVVKQERSEITYKAKIRNTIRYVSRDWNYSDYLYWFKNYNITRIQLNQDKVIPIIAYSSISKKTGEPYILYTNDLTYIYTDFEDNKAKIYRPYNKEYKWFTNCNQNDIGSINFLPSNGDLLIITKSYKDCRVIRNLGLNSIWLQNEGMLPSLELLENLCNRFKEIIVWFDNDSTGMAASKRLVDTLNSIVKNKSRNIFLPPRILLEDQIKDPSDLLQKKGIETLAQFIKSKNIILT